MNIVEIIEDKKHGKELTTEQIQFFVNGYTNGTVADYQMSALLMAIVLKGMTDRETFDLTDSMLHSGEVVDMSSIDGIVVDKHSTGGIGDSTTLALAPILACCGLFVAKMSGRGLGFTGGTIDKLESIPNLDTSLSQQEFFDVVKKVGCAVIGQTANLAPADKKMYSLRDVTATVDSIPLICGSIMSKKLAGGADTILLDVKFGSGSFMKDEQSALTLAQKLVAIGTRAGKKVGALITDMAQPLSNCVGNSLEIIGIIDVLKGERNRLYNETKEVAVRLMTLTGKFDRSTAEQAFDDAITSGKALDKFAEMVTAQHGDASYVYDTSKFDLGKTVQVRASCDGYVSKMDASMLGNALIMLGGGRQHKGDDIDHGVGIVMNVVIGSKVAKGDVLCTVYYRNNCEEAVQCISNAITIGDSVVNNHKIAYAYVDADGVIYY